MEKKRNERSFFGGSYGLFGSLEQRKKKKKYAQNIGRFNLLLFNVRRA